MGVVAGLCPHALSFAHACAHCHSSMPMPTIVDSTHPTPAIAHIHSTSFVPTWLCAHLCLLLYPGIRNSNINISFDLRLWFHTISHDYLPVLSDLVLLRTPGIRSSDRLLFYLTATIPPRTYIALALIFTYSGTPELRTPPQYLVYNL